MEKTRKHVQNLNLPQVTSLNKIENKNIIDNNNLKRRKLTLPKLTSKDTNNNYYEKRDLSSISSEEKKPFFTLIYSNPNKMVDANNNFGKGKALKKKSNSENVNITKVSDLNKNLYIDIENSDISSDSLFKTNQRYLLLKTVPDLPGIKKDRIKRLTRSDKLFMNKKILPKIDNKLRKETNISNTDVVQKLLSADGDTQLNQTKDSSYNKNESTFTSIKETVKYDPQLTTNDKCSIWLSNNFENGKPKYRDMESEIGNW